VKLANKLPRAVIIKAPRGGKYQSIKGEILIILTQLIPNNLNGIPRANTIPPPRLERKRRKLIHTKTQLIINITRKGFSPLIK
jgi:hypothetical protein